jgi:hypothetical protein
MPPPYDSVPQKEVLLMAGTTRRRFAAIAAMTPLALSAELPAQTQPQPAAPPPPPSKLPGAMTELVKAEFGPFLNEEEMTKIRGDFESWEPAMKRLRDFPLVNADEPDFTFTVRAKR